MPTASQVSTPLPLPFGFTLLPSQLPGRQFTPLLYTTLNGLPVYLTLSPSHAPHISFLPVLLALKVSTSPLSLLLEYGLSPNQFSLNVNGVAPYNDLWIHLDLAREIIRDLGAERVFWDDKGRGMLGKVGDAVSWEEGDGWYHNWLPPKSHLPSSSYSFDTLLSTSWSFVDIIPDDRCVRADYISPNTLPRCTVLTRQVFTACGEQRTAKIQSDALSFDTSMMRSGAWGSAWDMLLEWTINSWTRYQLSPSKFPIPGRSRRRVHGSLKSHPLTNLLPVIPTLLGVTLSTAIPLNIPDLQRLVPSTTLHSIAHLFLLLISALYRQAISLVPVLRTLTPRSLRPKTRATDEDQWRARLNIALCAFVSDLVIGIWRLRRENDKLHSLLQNRGQIPADIIVEPLPVDWKSVKRNPHSTLNSKLKKKRGSQGRRPSRMQSSPSISPSISPSSSEELDVIIELEKRRGGSPPPEPRTPSSKHHQSRMGHTKSQSRHSGRSVSPTHTPRRRSKTSQSYVLSDRESEPAGHTRSRSSMKPSSQMMTTPSSVSSSVKITEAASPIEQKTGHEYDDGFQGERMGPTRPELDRGDQATASQRNHGDDEDESTDTIDLMGGTGRKDKTNGIGLHDTSDMKHARSDGESALEVEDLLKVEDDPDSETEADAGIDSKARSRLHPEHKTSKVGMGVLTPGKTRRIHPWPSLIFSLIAVAAACFILQHSGPRY